MCSMSLLELGPLDAAALIRRDPRVSETLAVPSIYFPSTRVPPNLSASVTFNVQTSTTDQLTALVVLLHHL